jgi:hypothetical protein
LVVLYSKENAIHFIIDYQSKSNNDKKNDLGEMLDETSSNDESPTPRYVSRTVVKPLSPQPLPLHLQQAKVVNV